MFMMYYKSGQRDNLLCTLSLSLAALKPFFYSAQLSFTRRIHLNLTSSLFLTHGLQASNPRRQEAGDNGAGW